MIKLIAQTLGTFLLGVFLLGVLLFLPAGTFNYWQAWVFILVFMSSVSFIGVYLSLKDPALLERRKNVGPAAEQSPAQKIIITVGVLADLGLLVFCALDHRFGWSSPMPAYVSLIGAGLVALGLFIDLLVFRENSYGASNIKVEEGQRSHIDRSLRAGKTPHVRGSPHYGDGCTSGPWLMVGTRDHGSCCTRAGMEDPG